MIVKKPAILIYTENPDQDFLAEICAGIEEESVLYEIVDSQAGGSADSLALEAATESMLGSGVGIHGVDIAMQIRNVKSQKSVFSFHMPTFEECRALGANSARAIKKMPFRE